MARFCRIPYFGGSCDAGGPKCGNRSAADMAKILEEIENKSATAIAAKSTVRLSRDVSLSKSVRYFNICAISAFSVGIVLLGVFVGYNLWAN